MSLQKEKIKAIKMRKEGASYSQIKDVLKVSKSTLSLWLSSYPLSRTRLRELRDNSEQRIENFRSTMRTKKNVRLKNVEKKVAADIGSLTKRNLFIAGFFLYWGEGGKTGDCTVTVSNTDPAVLQCFIKWLELIKLPKSKLKVYVHLYSDMDAKKELLYWSKELGVPLENFRKPYIKKSLRKNISYSQRFTHGTCNVIVYGRDIAEYVMAGYEHIRSQFSKTHP